MAVPCSFERVVSVTPTPLPEHLADPTEAHPPVPSGLAVVWPLPPVPVRSSAPEAVPPSDVGAPPRVCCVPLTLAEVAPPAARESSVFGEPPALRVVLLLVLAPPIPDAVEVPVAPPVSFTPPVLEAPPAPPEPPAAVTLPVPCKVVTLEASRVNEKAPLVAVILPSLAKFLLEEVVKRSYEVTFEPLTTRLSGFVELFVFTMTRTTSELPVYAETYTPDVGLFVASTR